MPPFQALTSLKRKAVDEHEIIVKRQALSPANAIQDGISSQAICWIVQWRNPQQRKHKTWDGDAVLVVKGSQATLYDTDGKTLSSAKVNHSFSKGGNYVIGGKEIELDEPIPEQEHLSGQCFGSKTPSILNGNNLRANIGLHKPFVPPAISSMQVSSRINAPTTNGGRDLTAVPHRGASGSADENSSIESSSWTCNWRKKQGKKHKTWDGDAYISHIGNELKMISEDGKPMGSVAWSGQALHAGFNCYIGGKEVELDCQVSASQLPDNAGKEEIVPVLSTYPTDESTATKKFAIPLPFYGALTKPKSRGPLYDPSAEGAVVFKPPTREHIQRFNKKNLPIVPVVLDPILARRMRPHQIEGVKFLYECVVGLRKHEGQGCILADEMGLGKTLQTISLIWTLLKQNLYATTSAAVSKVLIVCPVTLVNNWMLEFHKWLGKDRVGVVACGKDKNTVKIFSTTKTQQVLIIGYEKLRKVIKELSDCVPPIGLIICDEGHRLKSANNKTTEVFQALRTSRRVILSGTPIQNDLGEFHAMANFCNPGLFDDYTTFRRVYEGPILKSRAPDATPKEAELGEARSVQLLSIARSFVLRREATILDNYLPPKHEYVVFVTPTALQLSIFFKILHPDRLDDLVKTSTAESLALINTLTKISNSPILLKATLDKNKSVDSNLSVQRAAIYEAVKMIPEKVKIDDMSLSGKLISLERMLEAIRRDTDEKCVLVSHYTSMLNILEVFCQTKGYSYFRLDGQTPQVKRQEFVNTFNKTPQRTSFIFLLSSKAGGVGINLIGASRLCLMDSDWNPSHDLQAMARCHRDGQKRPVFIYRFLTAGTIDEKIYQRQVTKLGLTDSLIGSGTTNSKIDSFSRSDLRDIFRVDSKTLCNTHDLLDCSCEVTETVANSFEEADLSDDEDRQLEQGFITASCLKVESLDKSERVRLQKKKNELAVLGEWRHINCLRTSAGVAVEDNILRNLIRIHNHAPDHPRAASEVYGERTLETPLDFPGGTISFLFEKKTTTKPEYEQED